MLFYNFSFVLMSVLCIFTVLRVSKIKDKIDNISEEEFIEYSRQVRKKGMVCLEKELSQIKNSVIKKYFIFLLEGQDSDFLKLYMDNDIEITKGIGKDKIKMINLLSKILFIFGTVASILYTYPHFDIYPIVATLITYAIIEIIKYRTEKNYEDEIWNLKKVHTGVLSILSGENPLLMQRKMNAFSKQKKTS